MNEAKPTELLPPDVVIIRLCDCHAVVAGINSCPYCGREAGHAYPYTRAQSPVQAEWQPQNLCGDVTHCNTCAQLKESR